MNSKGYFGETLAVNYLKKHGYKILDRNWISKFGELDIVCSSGETIIFVEVKYRASNNFCDIHEVLTPIKKLRLVRTMNLYLVLSNLAYMPHRLDFIGIIKKESTYEILHYYSVLC